MHKILMISCCILMVSIIALADDTTTETCAGGAGTIVVGSVSGYKYCMSNIRLNWWNANAWCDAIGRKVFNLNNCQCNSTIDCSSRCPEVNISNTEKYIWTENPYGTDRARHLSFSGNKHNNVRSHGLHYVLCK